MALPMGVGQIKPSRKLMIETPCLAMTQPYSIRRWYCAHVVDSGNDQRVPRMNFRTARRTPGRCSASTAPDAPSSANQVSTL